MHITVRCVDIALYSAIESEKELLMEAGTIVKINGVLPQGNGLTMVDLVETYYDCQDQKERRKPECPFDYRPEHVNPHRIDLDTEQLEIEQKSKGDWIKFWAKENIILILVGLFI